MKINAINRVDGAVFKHTFSFSDMEKKILRKRKKIKVADWAEKYRVLTMSFISGGVWKNNITKYLNDIMNVAGESFVRTIIICKSPQVGGSECANNWLGYAIDRDSGPVMYVYPDENTAKDNSKDRILPMIKKSSQLKKYTTGYEDDFSLYRINLQHMPIYFSWATSASRLANKPIKHLIFDEIDKYPLVSNSKEADPISLGEKRTLTFPYTKKIWKISTPTIEGFGIWKALNEESQVIFDYYVKCPFCEKYIHMKFDQIKWGDEKDSRKVGQEKKVYYECQECLSKWSDEKRNVAVQNGKWISRDNGVSIKKYIKEYKPSIVGFHIPAWLSFFVSLTDCAVAFLDGLKTKEKLKDFMNNIKAEPWIDYRIERKEDILLKLKTDIKAGIVPSNIACLTAGVDTQDRGFWYEIRAWGFGLSRESWQIRCGYVLSFDGLAQILFQDVYEDINGNKYPIRMALIDAMGHRTTEVYDFCRIYRNMIFPLKGEQRMSSLYSYSDIEFYPGTKKPILGGVKLIRVNVTHFKNDLSYQLEIVPADPGAWHLNYDCSNEWIRQLTAEYRNEKGYWECPKGRQNHGWDCSVYNLAAHEILGVRHWQDQFTNDNIKTKDEKVNPFTGGISLW